MFQVQGNTGGRTEWQVAAADSINDDRKGDVCGDTTAAPLFLCVVTKRSESDPSFSQLHRSLVCYEQSKPV